MGLSSAWVGATSRVPAVFQKIRDGQAPPQFTNQLLKDWGFTSSADRAFIPLLKALGFLTASGEPTKRYHDYRDHSRSAKVMADAVREAYEDIFLISEQPVQSDKKAVKGKFKSFHNASDDVAQRMTNTFYALIDLADLNASDDSSAVGIPESSPDPEEQSPAGESMSGGLPPRSRSLGLHYNIEIHLPATKDLEVYNAIFKSLREHFVE